MISPTELIAHAVPRLLEERGLRPHAPVGDEILFEGEVIGDPFWVMITPMPRDLPGMWRAMESLAGRFKPAEPASRGFGMLVLIRSGGLDPDHADVAALAGAKPREGTEPVLRAVVLDLSEGSVTGDLGHLKPMKGVAETLEKSARAALAGEKPPDVEAIVDREVNLARAYRASRPWATWAVVAVIAAIVMVQHYTQYVERLKLDEYKTPANRWDLLLTSALVYPVGKQFDTGMIWLVLAAIGVLSLGALVERLYGRAAFLAMWFAPSFAASYLAFKLEWGMAASPIGAMFGLTGCTLAMGFLRRALPWPFRKGLLISSAPMVLIFAIMVWVSKMDALPIVAVVLAGGLLAAVLPFRAPISADGGPLALRAVAWGLAIASLWGVGLATYRAYLRTPEAPKAKEHVSEEGWTITVPAGYQVQQPGNRLTVLKGEKLSIHVETSPIEEEEPLDRQVGAIREQRRRVGHAIIDEKMEIDGRPWWYMRVDDPVSRTDRYFGDVGGLRVMIEAAGDRGAVDLGQADLRSVVESFRPAR